MQYLVDNGSVAKILRDQKSAMECYVATLKATISQLEYDV